MTAPTQPTAWLPPLVTLAASGGDDAAYMTALYSIYSQDFINTKPTYPSRRWARKRHPEHQGRCRTFWHLITEGNDETNRTVDYDRCERIRWPRPIVDAVLTANIKGWRTTRGRSTRVCLATPDFSYLVVLEDRPTQGFIMLWTTYTVTYSRRRKQLEKEWANYTAAAGAWKG